MAELDYAANAMQREVVLSWRKFVMQNQIPDCIADADISVVGDHFTEGMIIRARGFVLGEKLPSHTETATGYATFEAPATWWQHVKHQHGHRWWLRLLVRRRPARMAVEVRRVDLTATWEQMAAYPWADLTTAVPQSFGLGRPVRLAWVESSLTWRDDRDAGGHHA